jgi:lipoprotein-releasing system permease protein
MTAIVVGAGALLVVLSVFNGFEDLVKSLYSTFYTDLKVLPVSGKTVRLTEEQIKQLRSFNGVKAVSLVAEDKALLQNGEMQSLVYMKGVDEQYTSVAGVQDYMLAGKFDLGNADQPSLVLGAGVENALGIQSDREILPVTAYVFRRGSAVELANPLQSLSSANMAPMGSFLIQQDFDNKYVLTNLAFIKMMLQWAPDEYSGAEIALNDPGQEKNIQRRLQQQLGKNYQVLTRYEQNRSLYTVMQVEKWVIYAILALILAVASFNMIGALTMLVMEKQKDIQVLKAMGANDQRIQRIFLGEGLLIALLGGGLGTLLALLLCWLQIQFHLIPLQGGSFVVNYYPVKVQWSDLLLVILTVLVVALLASWFPARKASLQPIELKT